MANKKYDYKRLTFEQMVDYIEKEAPKDKSWFKEQAINKDGKYEHLIAKKAFAERYMPEIIPQAKVKVKKSDILKDW